MNQTSSQQSQSSSATHSVLQKSSTLNRHYVKRPGSFQASDDDIATVMENQAVTAADDNSVAVKINVSAKANAEKRRKILVEEMGQNSEQLVSKHRMKINVEQIDNDSGLEQAITEQAEKIAPAAPNPYQSALNRSRAAAEAEIAMASAQEIKNQAIAEALHAIATPAQTDAIHSAPKATRAEKQAAKATAKARALATKQAAKATAKAKVVAEKQAKKQARQAQKTLREDDSTLAKTFKKQKRRGTGAKFLLAFATSAACVAALGYFVHLNMPDISVRVAAM